MTLLTAQPPNRPGCLVKALNVGSREVGRGDLPIVLARAGPPHRAPLAEPDAVSPPRARNRSRSEEHTSELQSRSDLVCRLLLEKKNTKITMIVSIVIYNQSS